MRIRQVMTQFLVVIFAVIMLLLPSVSDARPVLFPGGLTALPGNGGMGANLVQNTGFEAGSGATPANWTMPSGWARDTASPHGGAYSYLRTSGGSSATQTVTVAAGVYRLSGWMNWSNIGGANANVRLQIDFRPAYNEWYYKDFTGSSGGWQFVEIPNIVVPQDRTATIQLFMANNPTGTVRYDDISLQRQLPTALEVFMLYPNYRGMVFDDHPTQILRFDVAVNPATGAPADYRVRAALREEASGTLVSTQEPVAASSMTIEINGATMLYDRAYRVVLELLNSAGAVVYQYPAFRVSRVHGSDRATMGITVDHKNRVLFHGTPTFPLGVYDFGQPQFTADPAAWRGFLFDDSQSNLIPDGDERRMAGLPINMYLNIITGQLPADRSDVLMDVLQERGVRWLQLANCHQDATHVQMGGAGGFIVDTSDAYVQSIETHPGSAGVYTADECTTEMIGGADGTFTQYLRLRQLDPDGMTLGVNFANNELYLWADAVDVLATDPYPLFSSEPAGGYPHNMVADWTATNRNAVMGARPIMSVLQFFKFTSLGRFPTLEEMRSHSYMSIVEGANGLWWWSLGTQNGGLKNVYPTWTTERTQLMDRLKSVVSEIDGIKTPLLSDDDTTRLTTVQVVGESTNQLTLNIPAATIRTKVKVGSSGPLCTAPPCAWIFAYNYTNQSKTVDFTLNAPPGTVKVYAEGGRTIAPTGNTFRDTFAAYAAHVYVVQTGSGITASITSPANGAIVNGTVPVNMSVANAAAGNKTFVLSIDGEVKSTQTVSGTTASYNWNTATYPNNTAHTLSLTVTDSADASDTATISVTVNNGGGLTASITAPANNATVAGSTTVNMAVTNSTTPTSNTFNLKNDGSQIFNHWTGGSTDTYNWSLLNVSNGPHTLLLTVTDGNNNQGTHSIVVNVNNAITAAITSPINAATVSGTVTVNMQVTGQTSTWGHTFNLKVDGNLLQNQYVAATTDTYSWNTTSVSNGNHTLLLTVTDGVGKSATHSITVNVAN